MWKTVNEQISHSIHYPFKHTNKRQLASNSPDKLFHITDTQHHYLVKVAPKEALERLESESNALSLLTKSSIFMVPDCITTGATIGHAFSVLEWLTLDTPPHNNWHTMGKQLAMLHQKHEQAMFGFDNDNYLNTFIQPNNWHKKWDTFFAEDRIGWQLQLLGEKNIKLVEPQLLINHAKDLLSNHIIKPSLVHGNFWRKNIGFVNTVPTVFNPACYYGDREIDIAASELFSPLAPSFYEAYQQHYPLSSSYEQRKPLYQLYFILSQANLFAGQYINQAQQMINHILK